MNINTILKLTIFTVVILGICNIVAANIVATQGVYLSKTNAEIISLEKENRSLKNQIADATSLDKLTVWSQKNGYVAMNNVVSLADSAEVAFLR